MVGSGSDHLIEVHGLDERGDSIIIVVRLGDCEQQFTDPALAAAASAIHPTGR